MRSIYKSPEAKATLKHLYDEKLASIGIETRSRFIYTQFGRTHVLEAGPENGRPVIYLHGINAGAPLTLEALSGLSTDYRLIGIDSLGQATRSDETRLPLSGPDLGKWLGEVAIKAGVRQADWIGVSYGSFLLQKVIQVHPELIQKAIMVVPSGLVNGSMWESLRMLTIPLLRFHITKKDKHLRNFMSAFYGEIDNWSLRFQRATLLGMHMDYRRPPLLQAKDVSGFTQPVYIMVSDHDVFFPGKRAIERAKQLFSNLGGIYSLKNAHHIPERSSYTEIEQVIRGWLVE